MREPAAVADANAVDEHAPAKRYQRALRVEPGRARMPARTRHQDGESEAAGGDHCRPAPQADATDATTPSTDFLASVASD